METRLRSKPRPRKGKPGFRERRPDAPPFTDSERRAQAWLEATYPASFGPDIKPLPLGVRQEILADPRRPDDVSKKSLRTMIRWRTGNPDYIKKLAAPGARRWSLGGWIVESVSEEHAKDAKVRARPPGKGPNVERLLERFPPKHPPRR
jgi:hypothetical protein